MTDTSAEFTGEQNKIIKQLGRIRTFGFFFGLSAVVFLDVAIMEGDMLTHALDDIVIVLVSAVALALILARRKTRTLPQLKQLNNIMLIFAVIYLIMVFVAFAFEISDANDIGDDFPKIFIAAAMILNRFL